MSNLNLMFIVANLAAVAGWAALALAPGRSGAISLARIIGLLLAASYTLIFVFSAKAAGVLAEDYSVSGVQSFFDNPNLALLGWVHYLAFDLWVGTWEVEEADRTGMPYWALLPSLILTWMLGPMGLLLFIGLRAVTHRRDDGVIGARTTAL